MQNQSRASYPTHGQAIAMNDDGGSGSGGAVSRPGQPINQGRWTREEHQRFLDGLQIHGKEWKKISDMISSRSVVQIRTHAQKYFQKVAKSTGGPVMSTSRKDVAKSTGGPVMSTSKKDDVVRPAVVKKRPTKANVSELFSLASVSATMSAADTSPSFDTPQQLNSNMQGQQHIMLPQQLRQQQQQQQHYEYQKYQPLPPPPHKHYHHHEHRVSKPVRRTASQIQAIQEQHHRQQHGSSSYRKPNSIQVPGSKALARGGSSSSSASASASSCNNSYSNVLKRKPSFGGGLSDDREAGGGGATPRTMAAATILLHPRMQQRLQSGGDTPNTRQGATWLAAKQDAVDAALSKKRKSVSGASQRQRRGGSIDDGNLGPLAAATMMAIAAGRNTGIGAGSKRKHAVSKTEVSKRNVARHSNGSSSKNAAASLLAQGLSWEAVTSSH